MTLPDIIALGIIFFLLFCAVRYIAVSRKKSGCSGCCSHCRGCTGNDHFEKREKTNKNVQPQRHSDD